MDRARAWTRTALEAVFLLGVLAAVGVYSLRPNWDIDIFWHIRTGEWITQNWTLPHTDLFSATDPGRPWTPFQWLYEVLVYEVEARAGFLWVRLLHAGAFVAAFAGFWATFRRAIPTRSLAAFLMLLAVVLAGDRFRVRPEAFNFLFAALTLPALLGLGDRGGRPPVARLVLVGVVAALWANLHAGGALWLPLSAGAVLAGRVVRWLADRTDAEARAKVVSAAWILGVSTVLMLPWPGFVKGVVTAFTMYEESAILIPEWHPPAAYFMPEMAGRLTVHHVVLGLAPYLILALVGAGIALGTLRHRWRGFARRRDAGLLVLALLQALMAAHTARFIYLGAFALLALGLAFRDKLEAAVAHLGTKVLAVSACLLLAAVSYDHSIIKQRRGLSRALKLMADDHEPGSFPEAASDAIARMGLKGRIFHYTQWGGYLIYRHFPECTVFADGRGNFTVPEREALIATHKPYDREAALEAAWEQFHFDIVMFPPPTFPLLTWDRSKWFLAYQDDEAEVFLRVSEANQDNVRRALAYWGRMGLDVSGGPDAFQDGFRQVRAEENLREKPVRDKLDEAAQRAQSEDPRTRASGLYDGALVLFNAGRYHTAAKYFEKTLDQGLRHSTAALYLAWARFLDGQPQAAAATLATWFLDPEKQRLRDFGPLQWAGRRLLVLLGERVGAALPDAP